MSSFDQNTYFLITVVAGILWIIIRKCWESWRNNKKFKKNAVHIEKIPQMLDKFQKIEGSVEQMIKEITSLSSVMKSVGSVSVDLEEQKQIPQ